MRPDYGVPLIDMIKKEQFHDLIIEKICEGLDLPENCKIEFGTFQEIIDHGNGSCSRKILVTVDDYEILVEKLDKSGSNDITRPFYSFPLGNPDSIDNAREALRKHLQK